ncbi:MAG: elongation factor P [Rickettsiales bacterium]
MEKVAANSVRKDMILIISDALWKVAKAPEHVKPGKGPAYIQLELKNILTGTKKNERFSSSDVFDKAFIEFKVVEFLYADDEFLVVMDPDTFEQMSIEKTEMDATSLKLLEDSMKLDIQLYENKIINIKLQDQIIKEVIMADPHIKNSTVTNSLKNATLKGDVIIRVPGFVEIGDKVLIKVETLEFVKIVRE